MPLLELKNWFFLSQQMPEFFLQGLGVVSGFVLLLLPLSAILKILSSKHFKELYRIIGVVAKKSGEIGRIIAKEAAKNLELPEPYPRLRKFSDIVTMICCYLAAFLLASGALLCVAVLIPFQTGSFWVWSGNTLLFLVFGYFARFCFVLSEKERIRLFKKNDSQGS